MVGVCFLPGMIFITSLIYAAHIVLKHNNINSFDPHNKPLWQGRVLSQFE